MQTTCLCVERYALGSVQTVLLCRFSQLMFLFMSFWENIHILICTNETFLYVKSNVHSATKYFYQLIFYFRPTTRMRDSTCTLHAICYNLLKIFLSPCHTYSYENSGKAFIECKILMNVHLTMKTFNILPAGQLFIDVKRGLSSGMIAYEQLAF